MSVSKKAATHCGPTHPFASTVIANTIRMYSIRMCYTPLLLFPLCSNSFDSTIGDPTQNSEYRIGGSHAATIIIVGTIRPSYAHTYRSTYMVTCVLTHRMFYACVCVCRGEFTVVPIPFSSQRASTAALSTRETTEQAEQRERARERQHTQGEKRRRHDGDERQ